MDTMARPHFTQTGLSRVPGGPHDHLLAIYAMADRQTTWPEASRWRARQRGRRQVPVLRQETPRTGPHRPDVGLHVRIPSRVLPAHAGQYLWRVLGIAVASEPAFLPRERGERA